jgi:hypothetical protein
MSDLVVEEKHKLATDTVQVTNEKHTGEAGLYDVLVRRETGGSANTYW